MFSRIITLCIFVVVTVSPFSFASQFATDIAISKDDLLYYLNNPVAAEGVRYDSKDSNGNAMDSASIIQLNNSDAKYAAVYHTAYRAGSGWRFDINLATSNDLINWQFVRTLMTNADMPKIARVENGEWIVMVHEEWMTLSNEGASQSPSRIQFELFYTEHDLLSGNMNSSWTAPQYADSGLDGTPSFFSLEMDLVNGFWVVNTDIGFHIWDGERDSNVFASVSNVFSPENTTQWAPVAATEYNQNLMSQGVTGNIGQRESLNVANGSFIIQEGNIGTAGASWQDWRLWLCEKEEPNRYPVCDNEFVQLTPQTHKNSISFGNPSASIVDSPCASGGECGKSVVVSYFLFSEGAANGEAGPLIFYFDLPITQKTGWTEISFDDFENGWGQWEDQGNDVFLRKNTEHAHSGTAAVNIQDGQGPKSTTRFMAFDATQYEELDISFWFKPVSMETGEGFQLQFEDAKGKWKMVKRFEKGIDFNNNKEQTVVFNLHSSDYDFGENSRFRIRCLGNGNSDDIYLDDINVRGFVNRGE